MYLCKSLETHERHANQEILFNRASSEKVDSEGFIFNQPPWDPEFFLIDNGDSHAMKYESVVAYIVIHSLPHRSIIAIGPKNVVLGLHRPCGSMSVKPRSQGRRRARRHFALVPYHNDNTRSRGVRENSFHLLSPKRPDAAIGPERESCSVEIREFVINYVNEFS